MVRSTLALSLLALLGTAGCTGHAPQAQQSAQELQISVCLTLGTGCCDSDADCTSTATRKESCDTTTHMCQVTSDTSQCTPGLGGLVGNLLGACDDHDLCTVDSCGADGQCVHTATLLCCLTDVNCNDGNDCTIDTCSLGLLGAAGQCTHTAVPEPLCCNSNDDCVGDAVGACGLLTCQDDLVNPWQVCKALTPDGSNCCAQDSDCPQEACNTASCVAGACVYTPELGSGCCTVGTDCPVLSVCQLSVCTNATCGITVSLDIGCCTTAADCGAADSCTAVSCVDNQCVKADTCGGDTDCTGAKCFAHPVSTADMADPVLPTAVTSGADAGGNTFALRGGGCNVAPTDTANLAAFFMAAAALLFAVRRRRA